MDSYLFLIAEASEHVHHEGETGWTSIASLVVTVLFPFLTLALGWVGNTVTKNMSDISSLKTDLANCKESTAGDKKNQYTHKDAANDRNAIYAALDDIKDLLHKLDKQIPSQQDRERLKDEISQLRIAIVKGVK